MDRGDLHISVDSYGRSDIHIGSNNYPGSLVVIRIDKTAPLSNSSRTFNGSFGYRASPVIKRIAAATTITTRYQKCAYQNYKDQTAAEIEANADTFEQYATRAREAGIVIVPAMAFYGGLGDLLATAAMGDWSEADEICIAYGLSSWKPTLGTRAAGQVSRQRRDGRRIVFSKGRMEFRTDAAPITEWTFPAPIGTQSVVGEFTMADTLTISASFSGHQK